MQTKLHQRYSHGLPFLASYTYSHSIDDINNRTNAYDPRTGKGSSTFDLRHRLAFSPVWELPFGAGKDFLTTGVMSKLAGGWQLSPLIQWQTGNPLTPTLSGNYS